MPRVSREERFMRKTIPGGNGCILWTGWRTRDGYGGFWTGERFIGAHVFAYEQVHGPVPDGLELDHKCRVRPCVNADHLRPVTTKANILCGEGLAAKNVRKTHCWRGHEFNEENTYLIGTGGRMCRKCHCINSKNSRNRKSPVRKGATA